MNDENSTQQIEPAHPEQTDFPRVGYRARRWNRFERDLYAWMNRPEGQFECWLACRKIEAASSVAAATADAADDHLR